MTQGAHKPDQSPSHATVSGRWYGLSMVTTIPLLAAAVLLAQPWIGTLLPGNLWTITAVGFGALGLAAQVYLFWALRRHYRPLTMIHGAVGSWSHGEPSIELLRVADDGTELADNWNRLIKAWVASQKALRGVRAASKAAAVAAPEVGRSPIFDLLPQGLVVVDTAGKIRSANGAGCRMLMRSQERLVDAPFDRLIEDEQLNELVTSCATEPKPRGGTVESSLPQGDGHEAVIRSTVRPMGSGEDRQVLVVMEDVTHQRVADQSRNFFVAQATHELRTPLTNIGLYLERAIDLADGQVAERSECLNVINGEVGRLGRVIEEFLSVSEIEAGSLQIRRDDVRILELLERMEEEYGPQAKAKSLALAFDLPPKLSVVQGDREKISLALHNLVGNALKYTPEGKRVRVAVTEDDAGVSVSVSDTGIGIGPDDLSKVFDKFYRANDERLADIKGSGLGLPLAREVIRLHGGDITAESTLNEGSTFTLRLPLKHPAQTA